jgi:hypothetical protein
MMRNVMRLIAETLYCVAIMLLQYCCNLIQFGCFMLLALAYSDHKQVHAPVHAHVTTCF